MKKILSYVLATYMLVFTSCASILNGKNQKVTITTGSSTAKVYVDGEYVGKGKSIATKLKRDYEVRQFRVEDEGYKPEYYAKYQSRKSPLFVVSLIPFGILLMIPPLYDRGPKSFDYTKVIEASPKQKINERTQTQKYIYLKNTAFNVKKEDLKVEEYSKTRYDKNKASKNVTSSSKQIELDNSIFSETLSDILKEYKYRDTTNTIFKNKANTVYVSATVNKITCKAITLSGYRSYMVTDVYIDWEVLDFYEQPKVKQTIKATSGEFAIDYSDDKNSRDAFIGSIEDAITISFLKLLSDSKVKPMLTIEKDGENTLPKLAIAKPASAINSLSKAQNSTVTITTKKGHGSGCVVSPEGYIITAYHVVAGADKIEVILNDGSKTQAKIIRSNESSDISLLKVERSFEDAYRIPDSQNYEVGQEVFAIGTPTSVELGQTLSKGIVSGLRKQGPMTLIQTDASVNPGNSGGALVNNKGELIGIVNSKMMGVGIEGISFNVPAKDILSLLSLQYN